MFHFEDPGPAAYDDSLGGIHVDGGGCEFELGEASVVAIDEPATLAVAASDASELGAAGEGGPAAECSAVPGGSRGPNVHTDYVWWSSNGGKISFYAKQRIFEAVCPNKDKHGRCVKTKSAKADARGRNPSQGRPLGYLLCWLDAAMCPHKTSKVLHMDADFSYIARRDARARAIASGDAALLELLQCEREPFDHEDLEPEISP